MDPPSLIKPVDGRVIVDDSDDIAIIYGMFDIMAQSTIYVRNKENQLQLDKFVWKNGKLMLDVVAQE